MKKNLKLFVILIAVAALLIVGVTVTVYFVTRDDSNQSDYLPKDYGDDPSGLDDEHTGRY